MSLQPTIHRTTEVTFYGLVRMGHLREFMEAAKNCKDDAVVTFNIYRGDGREPSSTKLSVNDA